MLTFTPQATEKIRGLASREGREGVFLRVFVAPGGCHGLSYGMSWETQAKPNDAVEEMPEFRLVMDPLTRYLLRGSTVDYHDSLMQSGFDFINPTAKSSCACGSSFSSEEVPGDPSNCSTVPAKGH